MTHSGRFDCELKTAMPATLEAVEEFFVEFGRRSRMMMARANCFAAELVVREALTNAVVHGCGRDPGKQVRCWLRLRGNCLFIAVADDGEGFDWRAMRARTVDPRIARDGAWRSYAGMPTMSGSTKKAM